MYFVRKLTGYLSDTYFVIIFLIKSLGRFARGRLLPLARRHENVRKLLMEAFNSYIEDDALSPQNERYIVDCVATKKDCYSVMQGE